MGWWVRGWRNSLKAGLEVRGHGTAETILPCAPTRTIYSSEIVQQLHPILAVQVVPMLPAITRRKVAGARCGLMDRSDKLTILYPARLQHRGLLFAGLVEVERGAGRYQPILDQGFEGNAGQSAFLDGRQEFRPHIRLDRSNPLACGINVE